MTVADIALARAGIILMVANYPACVAFYRDKVGLEVLFARDEPGSVLTAFAFGGAYLMVEPADAPAGPALADAKLRLNVADVEAAATMLKARGVDVEILRHAWGTTAEFADPDGNRLALRSEGDFVP